MSNQITSYDQLAAEHALMGFARGRALRMRAGKHRWQVDLETGLLELEGLGTFRVQALGSHSFVTDTFLWVRANTRLVTRPEVTSTARALKERGLESQGPSVFSTPKLTASEVSFAELMFVCGELAGGLPVYDGVFGDGAIMLIVDTPVTVEIASPAELLELMLDMQQISTLPLAACVPRFLERLGFTVDYATNVEIQFSGPGFPPTRIELDGEGRVSAMTGTMGRAPA